MKAYIAKNGDGSVTRGWLLRSGYSINSPMCRLTRAADQGQLEEVPIELAVRSAGSDIAPRDGSRDNAGSTAVDAGSRSLAQS